MVLAWIKSQSEKLNCFVKNRVNEIQSFTNKSDWSWVSSIDNPADLLSRGLHADKLASCVLWWKGPKWLAKPTVEWPLFTCTNQSSNQPINQFNPNLNSGTTEPIHCNVSTSTHCNDFLSKLFLRYSSFNRLVRVLAYIFRFIHNTKTTQTNARVNGPLSVQEHRESQNKLIQFAQIECYANEYNLLKNNKPLPQSSCLLTLNPFMENGLMRVGGRIGLSQYPHNKKHPIILPPNHNLTNLILQFEHIRLLHCGPQLLLSSIRERFWPIHGKSLANKIVHKCVTCFRAKPRTHIPIMGNLPTSRIEPSLPFLKVSVDYGGPYIIRDRRGRGYKTNKAYIAIFVCMATKAVHIELISGLDTAAFLSAYRRFISRRGKPGEMLSDNGTTFHGANNEISQLYEFISNYSDELTTSFSNEGIEWKFLPAYTPHMAGLHESAVRCCKYHLKRVLGQALLTYEEFSTILTQIEGILNSRPLCPIPNADSDEITYLSPAHFLLFRTPVSLPDYDYLDVPTNRLTYFQQLQQLQQDFWRRWSRDYIGLLQERTKWRSSKGAALSPGTVVLVKEERLPPCRWRLGRIVDCCAGQDGVTRVAHIRTAGGTIKRAFNNICPLPNNNVID